MKRAVTSALLPSGAMLVEGTVVDDDHGLVKSHPSLFEDAAAAAARANQPPATFGPEQLGAGPNGSEIVEHATARPGTKRFGKIAKD